MLTMVAKALRKGGAGALTHKTSEKAKDGPGAGEKGGAESRRSYLAFRRDVREGESRRRETTRHREEHFIYPPFLSPTQAYRVTLSALARHPISWEACPRPSAGSAGFSSSSLMSWPASGDMRCGRGGAGGQRGSPMQLAAPPVAPRDLVPGGGNACSFVDKQSRAGGRGRQ